MFPSRRTEPFRYIFVTPESCTFQLIELNGQPFESKQAAAELIDIHKSGCKLATPLDLRAADNAIKIRIEFPFFEDGPLTVTGEIRWQQTSAGTCLYGVMFHAEDDVKERIKAELRRLAGQAKINAV